MKWSNLFCFPYSTLFLSSSCLKLQPTSSTVLPQPVLPTLPPSDESKSSFSSRTCKHKPIYIFLLPFCSFSFYKNILSSWVYVCCLEFICFCVLCQQELEITKCHFSTCMLCINKFVKFIPMNKSTLCTKQRSVTPKLHHSRNGWILHLRCVMVTRGLIDKIKE